ncbi:condensation domain-containing protein [Dyadobacter diqingensis]|uniref:condensation domain-containing protein n=1 Tax=Dyadobacter diqingensis TaxID=2938121 RepID=UPI0020C1B3BE|nr:condensation domain-containing protein [Dyadobacter diqingensis]
MKRKLLFLERVLYGNGSQPFHGVFSVKIAGRIIPENFPVALRKLQEKYPILTACIEEDEKGDPYFVRQSPAPEIPLRIATRLSDQDWIDESRYEWATSFQIRTGPLLRVVWIRSDEVSDLILAFHHCMCDGGSGMALLTDLLALLDNTDHEIGTSSTFSSLDDLIPASILNNNGKKIKAGFSSGLVNASLAVMSNFISTKNKILPQRESDYLISWKLSQEESSALFAVCKKHQVTVNTALCLAFLEAFKMVNKTAAHGKATCPVDIRRYMPEVKRDTIFAFGLAMNMQLAKKPAADFWVNAEKQQVLISKQMEKLNPYEFIMGMEGSHKAIRHLIKFLTYAKAGNDFMFSNMGRLDIPSDYRTFTIETVYSPTVIGPFGNPTTIITTTFNKQMDFSFVSNEMFMARENAMKIRQEAMKLMFSETFVGDTVGV